MPGLTGDHGSDAHNGIRARGARRPDRRFRVRSRVVVVCSCALFCALDPAFGAAAGELLGTCLLHGLAVWLTAGPLGAVRSRSGPRLQMCRYVRLGAVVRAKFWRDVLYCDHKRGSTDLKCVRGRAALA